MASINLEQLKTFLTVVRMGSIRKAAVGLNLTQPAVTTRIKSLEESLSVKLFERSSGGLKLTKRGKCLSGMLSNTSIYRNLWMKI